MDIRELVEEAYATARDKGWYPDENENDSRIRALEHLVLNGDENALRDLKRVWLASREPSVGERISLMHSELSEGLEEWRNGHPLSFIYYHGSSTDGPGTFPFYEGCKEKPEGLPIELADVVIRIADFCGRHGIDLDAAIKAKLAFNKTRPKRHGGKLA